MANTNNPRTGSAGQDRNADAITGAPGSHPLGTGIGTTSGALTGAALGAIGGPIGAAIGLIAGGITGAVIGHKAGEANDPTEDWRESYSDKPYFDKTHDYDRDVAPAYRYGSTLAASVDDRSNDSVMDE